MNAPSSKGIYPVKLSNGDHCCAMWNGLNWCYWDEVCDPPEWDDVIWLNCRVVEWHEVNQHENGMIMAANIIHACHPALELSETLTGRMSQLDNIVYGLLEKLRESNRAIDGQEPNDPQ